MKYYKSLYFIKLCYDPEVPQIQEQESGLDHSATLLWYLTHKWWLLWVLLKHWTATRVESTLLSAVLELSHADIILSHMFYVLLHLFFMHTWAPVDEHGYVKD